MRALFLGVMTLISNAACSPQPPVPLSEQSLRISNQITLAGELNPAAIESLHASGSLVIDLRTDSTAVQTQAELLEHHNVSYHSLPVAVGQFDAATVHRFQQLLAEANDKPVVVHCNSGNRAGLLWAAHLLEQGETLETVLTTVQPLTTKPGVVQAIKDYATRQ